MTRFQITNRPAFIVNVITQRRASKFMESKEIGLAEGSKKTPVSYGVSKPTELMEDELASESKELKEREVVEVGKKIAKDNIGFPTTFCALMGCNGMLLLLFSLFISGLLVYITFLYTKRFQAFHRSGVAIFMVLAILYSLLPLIYCLTWKKMVKKTLHNYHKSSKSSKYFLLRVYDLFRLNGKYFLWKLYLFELAESVNQILNIKFIYLCTLPVEISSIFCIALSLDAMFRAYHLRKQNTVARRNRQVKLDLIIDFFCVAGPVCSMWFLFGITISVTEMLQIILLPSIFSYSKVRTLLRQTIAVRIESVIIRRENPERKNRSIKYRSRSETQCEQQQKQIPKVFYSAFFVYNILYSTTVFVIAIVHLTQQTTDCDDKFWSKGCLNKIPFCKNLFNPSCDCASLKIENDKSLVQLPDSLTTNMTGLRKILIHNCNLTVLPPRMEKLTNIVEFDISFNSVEKFNVDVGKWRSLENLYLRYNRIHSYNKNTIFTHKNLLYLDLSDNVGLELPEAHSKIFMPSLLHLALANNTVEVNTQLDGTMFPNLLDLYLNGNSLRVFPHSSLQNTLQYLGVARCQLGGLPSYLKHFRYLAYLDARDNNISYVPEGIKTLIEKNHMESYFANNAVCNSDDSLNCKPLCSKYCWSEKEPNNGFCSLGCNSKKCKYDGGDCV